VLLAAGEGKFTHFITFTVGLAEAVDGIEITLLSYLAPCVALEWDLGSFEQGALTASVFAGEMAGAIVFGVVSDIYGRRKAFLASTLLVFCFGILTALAPSYLWLVLSRAMVGVGAGGMEAPFDLLSELVPTPIRDRTLLRVQVLWAVGTLFMGMAAWAVLGHGWSWRILALVAAFPPFLLLCCFGYVPESPRWLLANGRVKDAKVVLHRVASWNGVDIGEIKLRHYEARLRGREGHIEELWAQPEQRRVSLILWGTWISFGFQYYGVVLLGALVLGSSEGSTCDYNDFLLFVNSSSELLAYVLSGLYTGLLGSVKSMVANFAVSALATALMLVGAAGLYGVAAAAFLARGCACMASLFAWAVT
ncbi:unnamed protein product, partial [Discosporangium mesarthrocarpum]